ncbi:trichohyalin-like [Macrobrachium nipponense]|uniref:trichohyalin-like n=1 Tax=Macrobrachium nipponense TaxID=159736 RepID=UPI0030C7A413
MLVLALAPCELCLKVFGLNLLVFVLALVPCEVYYLIVQELLYIIQCRGPTTGHSLESLHHAVVAESWSPEVVETRLDSRSIETPASAGAVPWMALMAVALALLLAVYWKRKLFGCDDLDREEEHLEVPTVDLTLKTEDLECSEEEEEEEEEDLDSSDDEIDDMDVDEEEEEVEDSDSSDDEIDDEEVEEEEEEEKEKFDSYDENEEEEEEVEELYNSDDDDNNQEKEEEEEEEELDSSDEDEKISGTEDLETTEEEEEEENELERQLNDAKKDIVRLQDQILEKDLLIEKKAAEETEMKRKIEVLNIEKEHVQYEKQELEKDCVLALGLVDIMENVNDELMAQITSLENELEQKDHFLMKRDVEERELRSVFEQTIVEKDRELESTLEKANEERLRLTILENQILDMKAAYLDLQQQQEVTQVEKSRFEELATCYKGQLETVHKNVSQLEDENYELEKNLANETQINLSLQNGVLILNDRVQSLQSALRHKESQLVSATETLNTERAKNEITGAELEVMRNWVSELGGENAKITEELGEAILAINSLKKELGEELKKAEILRNKVQAMRNWVTELRGQNNRMKEDLEDKCLDITLLSKKLGDEQKQTQILRDEVLVMRNWVSELGGENATVKEALEEALLEVTSLKNSLANEERNALHHRSEMETLLKEERKRGDEMETSLRIVKVELHSKQQQIENFVSAEQKLIHEKQELEDKLEVALNRGNELERESSEMRLHYQEKLKDKDNEKDKLKEREEQLQKNLESAMCQQQNLESSLKLAERDICSLKKSENTNLQELEHLREEFERLREKCRMQDETIIKERKRVREHLRMQEEELRNHDKYMLMALLHGTAQRNFYLEHIALENRKKDLDNETLKNSEEENKSLDQEENLQQQLQKVEEDQYREYCNAQREKKNYGKQWEVLTQMVEDLIEGNDQKKTAEEAVNSKLSD